MISMDELLKGARLEDQDQDVQKSLKILLERVNKIRTAYGKPMTVTSGLRTKEDHIRVYKEKAAKEGKPFDDKKIPWGSQHLKGCAVDVYDPNQDLQQWCLDNVDVLENVELWCEDFSATHSWVHFQIRAPRSGNRFFKP